MLKPSELGFSQPKSIQTMTISISKSTLEWMFKIKVLLQLFSKTELRDGIKTFSRFKLFLYF